MRKPCLYTLPCVSGWFFDVRDCLRVGSRHETSTSANTSGGRSKRTAAASKSAGSIVVEVCGNVKEDVKQAHGKLKVSEVVDS